MSKDHGYSDSKADRQGSQNRALEEKLKEIREYCLKHKEQMWAATIGGIIDECDFRDFGSGE